MEVKPGDYSRGIQYLTAAKRILAVARKLDDEEANHLRKVADRLQENGLGLVLRGAKGLEAALRQQSGDASREG